MNKNTHGGKRKGSGAKKKPPRRRHELYVDVQNWEALKKIYTTKEINAKIRFFLNSLEWA